MPIRLLLQLSALASCASGLAFIGFMLLHPYGMVSGAAVALDPRWVPAHSLHFLGALLALFALTGLYVHLRKDVAGWGLAGYVIAFAGTAMFTGTGMITAFIWPVVASVAPEFVDADGAMFTHPLTSASTGAPYVLMVVGYLLLSVVLWKRAAWPRWAAALLVTGIVMFSAPVEPVGAAPWVVRVAGSILFGVAFIANGAVLWSRIEPLRVEAVGPATSPQ